MNRRSQAKLFGAIRLVPDEDTIGIPLFTAGGNAMFVPEMDADFRITRFLDFYNEEGYRLEYELPSGFQGRKFGIGNPTPLPFWFQQSSHVIEGDAEREDVEKLFGSAVNNSPVLADLGNLLHDARTGVFQRRNDRWTAADIASGFGDVFNEPPVHSRYWISRYTIAVANARAKTVPPHPIDVKLRRTAFDWLSRFATKTDYLRLIAVLGKPESGIIPKRRFTEILFAFVVNKIATDKFKEIEKYVDHPTMQESFPFGMSHHLDQRGWPKVPFSYAKPDQLGAPLTAEIWRGKQSGYFDRAAKLTFLLYKKGRVPKVVDDIVMPILNERMTEFKRLHGVGDRVFGNREYEYLWEETAKALLSEYDRLMVLDGILNGDARMSKVVVEGRFGVGHRYLDSLKKYLERS